MYFFGFGEEKYRSAHIVFFNKKFLIDHLEYTLSSPNSNLFKVVKLFKWKGG